MLGENNKVNVIATHLITAESTSSFPSLITSGSVSVPHSVSSLLPVPRRHDIRLHSIICRIRAVTLSHHTLQG